VAPGVYFLAQAVNAWKRSAALPTVEMGIGVATYGLSKS